MGCLRKQLFQYKTTSKCAICNQDFNIGFLVCAHIKKRSKCTEDEMRNINNVVRMCKFGCDELFERGYVAVVDGVVKVLKNTNNTKVIDKTEIKINNELFI